MSSDYAKELARRRRAKLLSTPVELAHNSRAEWTLLAAAVDDWASGHDTVRRAIVAGVTPDQFLDDSLGELWAICVDLVEQQRERLTRATLERLLALRSSLDDERVRSMLGKLFDADLGADLNALADDAAREVVECAERRAVQLRTLELAHEAASLDLSKVSSRLDESARSVNPRATSRQRRPVGEVMPAWRKRLLARAAGEEGVRYKVGLPGVDTLLDDGFTGGRLYYIGGEEKVGKTKFVTHAVGELMRRHDAIVDWFSVEMTEEDTIDALVTQRINAERVEVGRAQKSSGRMDTPGLSYSHREITRGRPSDVRRRRPGAEADFLAAVASASEEISARNLYLTLIDDETAQDVYALVRQGVTEHQAAIDEGRPYVVVVDYVQDLEPGVATTSDTEKIKQVSRTLRKIAKVLEVIVIGVFHTNRDAQKRGRPAAHHVFGSSKLQKDADHLVFVHRPGMDGDHWQYCEIISSRSRHCAVGTCSLRAHLGHNVYEPWVGPAPIIHQEDQR